VTEFGTLARGGERPVIVVTRRLPAAVEDALVARYDARLNTLDDPLDADRLRDAAAQADGLLCTVTDRIGAELFATPGRRMRIVANYGVGVNHIALDAARAAGVMVTNTPDVLTDDTADLTMALLLAVARRVGEGERVLRAGAWPGWAPTQLLGTRVSGATLGIVGYGRIGQAVARRAHHGFGMRVLYHQRHRAASEAEAAASAEYHPSLDTMLGECDVISLHCPSTPETRGLIDGERLRRMRPTAFLLNTARGDVVDEAALADALREGWIAGAGLDVFAREPVVTPALLRLDNAVLLPHLGSATNETRTAMGMRALANLDVFFAGMEPPDRVA
jgi:lactate dehydrogenase-like 2-hydroxyacid dehydrogenase